MFVVIVFIIVATTVEEQGLDLKPYLNYYKQYREYNYILLTFEDSGFSQIKLCI